MVYEIEKFKEIGVERLEKEGGGGGGESDDRHQQQQHYLWASCCIKSKNAASTKAPIHNPHISSSNITVGNFAIQFLGHASNHQSLFDRRAMRR